MNFLKFDKKQLIKSFVYRTYAFAITFLSTFLLTGNVELSITLGIIENIFKILTYYWFDILWNKMAKILFFGLLG